MPPEERRIGIVFQSYALWPHMTVAENVAYGLTSRASRIGNGRRVHAALALVELEGFAERRPAFSRAASGNEVACPLSRDRAVARAARRTAANLDVHLRAAMERFARFHERRHDDDPTSRTTRPSHGARRPHRASRTRRVLHLRRRAALSRAGGCDGGEVIGEGMVVPVESWRSNSDGTCDVDVFGHRMRMRCATAQRRAAASACLRALLRIVAPGQSGLRARVMA